MKDKAVKFKKPEQPAPEYIANLRDWCGGDECKVQFILWANTTYLDIAGMRQGGEPVFRPAICAWEGWKAAWAMRH